MMKFKVKRPKSLNKQKIETRYDPQGKHDKPVSTKHESQVHRAGIPTNTNRAWLRKNYSENFLYIAQNLTDGQAQP